MHMCTSNISLHWPVFVYMGFAVGIRFFGIITIYLSIIRQTRRINTMIITTLVSTSTRDLRVLQHILILIGILGMAGFPSLVLVIWNAISGEAPIPLYLFCALTVSFCTAIQISFIFIMNKKIRVVFRNHIRHLFYS